MILFLVSTIFLEFSILILGSAFRILLTASPIIPTFRSIALFVFRSFRNLKKSLLSGRKKFDLFDGLFDIGKPGPDIIFHIPGLLFYQFAALGTGFLSLFVPGDPPLFLANVPTEILN